jgi:hypothetical protein
MGFGTICIFLSSWRSRNGSSTLFWWSNRTKGGWSTSSPSRTRKKSISKSKSFRIKKVNWFLVVITQLTSSFRINPCSLIFSCYISYCSTLSSPSNINSSYTNDTVCISNLITLPAIILRIFTITEHQIWIVVPYIKYLTTLNIRSLLSIKINVKNINFEY